LAVNLLPGLTAIFCVIPSIHLTDSQPFPTCFHFKLRISPQFIPFKKQALGIRAKGRKVVEAGEAYQLRELQVSYPANFGLENDDIGAENTYFRDVYQ
jgi:hypothetical protein